MPTATATLRNLQISPRKVRLVADLIRGQRVAQARDILHFTVKDAALPLRKLLDSVVANAENAAAERNDRIDTDELVVSTIMVNEGRTLRRFIPAPRGRAMRIRKRSSQVHIIISDK
ncbi:MAG: 50S ribosomal protein L22 [Candidatus Hydrogenedentes bacterium]|nr:50S ribosomal protein L22 [Candidatus Hydrogenedentota bacterium]MBI3118042.1 50S ribosomal protein L22 [Candidatus Hydrogenedentota bacterium]